MDVRFLNDIKQHIRDSYREMISAMRFNLVELRGLDKITDYPAFRRAEKDFDIYFAEGANRIDLARAQIKKDLDELKTLQAQSGDEKITHAIKGINDEISNHEAQFQQLNNVVNLELILKKIRSSYKKLTRATNDMHSLLRRPNPPTFTLVSDSLTKTISFQKRLLADALSALELAGVTEASLQNPHMQRAQSVILPNERAYLTAHLNLQRALLSTLPENSHDAITTQNEIKKTKTGLAKNKNALRNLNAATVKPPSNLNARVHYI